METVPTAKTARIVNQAGGLLTRDTPALGAGVCSDVVVVGTQAFRIPTGLENQPILPQEILGLLQSSEVGEVKTRNRQVL